MSVLGFVGSGLSPQARRPPTETTSRHCLGDTRHGASVSRGNHVCNAADPSRDLHVDHAGYGQRPYRDGAGRRAFHDGYGRRAYHG
jgi:hypothetical protein